MRSRETCRVSLNRRRIVVFSARRPSILADTCPLRDSTVRQWCAFSRLVCFSVIRSISTGTIHKRSRPTRSSTRLCHLVEPCYLPSTTSPRYTRCTHRRVHKQLSADTRNREDRGRLFPRRLGRVSRSSRGVCTHVVSHVQVTSRRYDDCNRSDDGTAPIRLENARHHLALLGHRVSRFDRYRCEISEMPIESKPFKLSLSVCHRWRVRDCGLSTSFSFSPRLAKRKVFEKQKEGG